tara:strand:+ start:583 stop:1893 length:1311 start_codon:yes stop_codon:yes gene_type:complete
MVASTQLVSPAAPASTERTPDSSELPAPSTELAPTQKSINKIKDKIKEKKLKLELESQFVFEDEWRRTHFSCQETQNADLYNMYLNDTFDNQKQFGRDIVRAFDDLQVVNVLAVAPTQSGKTGSMLATIYEFTRTDFITVNDMRVSLQNVFIFTTHSSREWLLQTQKRFPYIMKDQIFHRNQHKQFIKRVQNIQNALIIVDECHIASKVGQTLFNTYKSLGFYDIHSLYKNNIKLLHFTATPNILTQHLEDAWQKAAKVVYMDVPKNYLSHEYYVENNQILEAKPLFNHKENILEILQYMGEQPAYHIIRTNRGNEHFQTIAQFKLAFKDKQFKFISEPIFYKKHKTIIFDSFKHKPTQHTFVFIIDKLRCAKSLHIQHISVLYDRFVSKPSHDSILQGLSGRCTGFHSYHSHIHIFTQFKHILPNNLIFSAFKPC